MSGDSDRRAGRIKHTQDFAGLAAGIVQPEGAIGPERTALDQAEVQLGGVDPEDFDRPGSPFDPVARRRNGRGVASRAARYLGCRRVARTGRDDGCAEETENLPELRHCGRPFGRAFLCHQGGGVTYLIELTVARAEFWWSIWIGSRIECVLSRQGGIMSNYCGRLFAGLAILALVASPASAQYAARLTVTGGTHAGTFEMHRPNCTIDGGSRITMVDTTVTTQTDRLANLMVSPTAFTFGFGMTASPAGYSKTDGSHLRGSGLLRINWMYMDSTFTATYSGVTRRARTASTSP